MLNSVAKKSSDKRLSYNNESHVNPEGIFEVDFWFSFC
jgi:hypothetical protein